MTVQFDPKEVEDVVRETSKVQEKSTGKRLVKTTDQRLTIGTSSFSKQQLLSLLQRTPDEHVYSRPAKGGGEWEYVTGTYIRKVLNYTFNWMWSFEIRSVEEKYGEVIVHGRLTIQKEDGSILIWKEDFGKKEIAFKKGTTIPLDYGNDENAAATDCLKRCASQLGIASDVYGKEEFKEIKIQLVPEDEIESPSDALPITDLQTTTLSMLDPKNDHTGMTQKQAKDCIKKLTQKGK